MAKFHLSKKSLLIIIIAVSSVIVLAGITVGSVYLAGYVDTQNQKKAVIILPGLFASGLYDEATGADVWDPFTMYDIRFTDIANSDKGMDLNLILDLAKTKEFDEQFYDIANNTGKSFLSLVGMNEDGTPIHPSIKPVPFESSSRLRYGVINAHREMYETLQAEYGASHKVEVFNYDFRLDNRASAKALEDHINAKKYKEVILVSHSNGGAVADCYIARSKANRDKVKLNVSISSPHLGAFSALTILENIDGYLDSAKVMISTFPSFLADNLLDIVDTAFETQFKSLANMWAVYQMLPSFELLNSQQYRTEYRRKIYGLYGNGSGRQTFSSVDRQDAMLVIDGKDYKFKNRDELFDFYCSRPWAKMSNGQIKPQLASLKDYWDSMYAKDEDGERVHATELVDTRYLCGVGYRSVYVVGFEGDGEGGGKLAYDANGKLQYTGDGDLEYTGYGNKYTEQSDGTVLLYSATAGTFDYNRITILPYTDHYEAGQAFNAFTAPTVLPMINAVLTGWDRFLIDTWGEK